MNTDNSIKFDLCLTKCRDHGVCDVFANMYLVRWLSSNTTIRLTHCNALQRTATHCKSTIGLTHCNALQHTATHSNTLQYTAMHCNALQCTETHCDTLRHTATHCNILQHTATHCNTTIELKHCKSLQHTATHCNALQITATQCNTLQHTATQLSSSFMSDMGWLRLVGCLKIQVSFAKELYKIDLYSAKRPVFLSILLIVATP